MIDLESLYFEWLLTCLHPEGVTEEIEHISDFLHNCEFRRRVGNDINRAQDGVNLRIEFLHSYDEADISPNVTNDLMRQECSWFEMLIALARNLDYLYEGGVEGRYIELVTNLGLGSLMSFGRSLRDVDQHTVDVVTDNVDYNRFDRNGLGGLFPLEKLGHPDQRTVEIWDQHAAYFHEKLEGVMWTSTR